MKRWITFLFVLVQSLASAQEVLKPFEVETEAQPRGGLVLLEKFIEVNRRMPYAAEVDKVKGVVYVAGNIGTDGRISDVKVVKGLHPACDREAVRVLSLFKAWQPAQKGGKDVPMQFTYGIKFVTARQGCALGAITTYFDQEGNPVTSETAAAFRMVQPVDSLGVPVAAPGLEKRRGTAWKKSDERYSFFRKQQVLYNDEEPLLPDSAEVEWVGLQSGLQRPQGPQYTFYKTGGLYSVQTYEDGKPVGTDLYYFPNGLVRKASEHLQDGGVREWLWDANGQLRQVAYREVNNVPFMLVNQWDSLGRQLVKEGAGRARLVSRVGGMGWVLEEGNVAESLRDGVWTGKVATGKPLYRETWETGRFLNGLSYTSAGDSLAYDQPYEQPVFQGGQQAMYQFLAQNIRYPVEAARNRIQGRVFIGFVVCTDGTLCEFKVLRGVESSLDEEALRVVKKMSGKWKAGIQRGHPVRVRYNLPINFAFQ